MVVLKFNTFSGACFIFSWSFTPIIETCESD